MELVQKVIEVIGGVNNAVCASFLSQLEVYDEDVGLVAKVNTQQHKCLLFPIADFMNSALILKISAGNFWKFTVSNSKFIVMILIFSS